MYQKAALIAEHKQMVRLIDHLNMHKSELSMVFLITIS